MELIENLWAIEELGQLVCWRCSNGVPFLTPSHCQAVETAASSDVIDVPHKGAIRTVVQVHVTQVEDITLVIDPQTNHIRCLLRSVDTRS